MDQNQQSNSQTTASNDQASVYSNALTGSSGGSQTKISSANGQQLTQIMQQVTELTQSLHQFVDQDDFADASLLAASGVLEGHLNQYHLLASQKEHQNPGLKSF